MNIRIALAGNPNSGKTTLFNALTGSNQFGRIFAGGMNIIGVIVAAAILAGMLYMLFVKKYYEATTLTTSDAKKIEAVGKKWEKHMR